VPARLQSGIAVSTDGDGWVLLNASPDAPIQIERYLSDPSTKTRSSPVSNVLLTNADLDHVIGLLLMRENHRPLRVTAPASVRRILSEEFPIGGILTSFCGIEWTDIGADERKIVGGLLIRCVLLNCRKPPRYSKQPECDVVGYVITDPATKRTAGFFPDLGYLDDELLATFRDCDALFLDGTFWSESEMQELKISQFSATEMGHLPISGGRGSLMKVAPLQRPLCAYIHINNTNLILLPNSPERQTIENSGIVVAEDGMSLKL
jgi:pyrroloquinoline quinone biosynthesis protein B